MEIGKVYHGSTTVRKFVTDKKVNTRRWKLTGDTKEDAKLICSVIYAEINILSRENPYFALNTIDIHSEDLNELVFCACLSFRDLSKTQTDAKD